MSEYKCKHGVEPIFNVIPVQSRVCIFLTTILIKIKLTLH